MLQCDAQQSSALMLSDFVQGTEGVELRAMANEIMRGRSERVTTEAIWTREQLNVGPNFKLQSWDNHGLKWHEEREEEGTRADRLVLLDPIPLVPLATTRNCHYS